MDELALLAQSVKASATALVHCGGDGKKRRSGSKKTIACFSFLALQAGSAALIRMIGWWWGVSHAHTHATSWDAALITHRATDDWILWWNNERTRGGRRTAGDEADLERKSEERWDGGRIPCYLREKRRKNEDGVRRARWFWLGSFQTFAFCVRTTSEWWCWWFTDIPEGRYCSGPIETDETRFSSYLQSVVQTWCCRTGQRVEFVLSWNEHPVHITAVLRWVMCLARGPKSNSAQGPIKPGTGSESCRCFVQNNSTLFGT